MIEVENSMGACCSTACPLYQGRLPFSTRRLNGCTGFLYRIAKTQYMVRFLNRDGTVTMAQTFVNIDRIRLKTINKKYIIVETADDLDKKYASCAVFRCSGN